MSATSSTTSTLHHDSAHSHPAKAITNMKGRALTTTSLPPPPTLPSPISQTRGALIVLEGGDRCGKTTQARLLHEKLNQRNIQALSMHFPDRSTPIGQTIHSYLTNKTEMDDKEIHLLFSKNRWEAREKMLQTLQDGTTLIVDRYAYSGVAFTAAKGLDVDWCKHPDIGLPRPDLVLYLDVSKEARSLRQGYGEERYENDVFQEKVREIFLNQLMDPSYWMVIDANQSIEDLHQTILQHVLTVVQAARHTPVLDLWKK